MSYRQTRGGSRPNGGARSFSNKSSRSGFNRGRSNRGGSRGVAKKYINPAKFINKATAKAEEIPYVSKYKFTDFNFNNQLQHNIAERGYEKTSSIQDQTIPHIIEGKDVIGIANTGTGKTAAFLLPIIEHMTGVSLRPGVLIVAPTRELAQQINDEFKAFSQGLGLYSTLVVWIFIARNLLKINFMAVIQFFRNNYS